MPGDYQLQVLAAAVTPVVLVSASAILISGVNSRYIAVADRMRSLAGEYRDKSTDLRRREVISLQMVIFRKRVILVSWAERMLYFSVGCFTSVALMISSSLARTLLDAASLPIFTLGITLIMVAIVLQLSELHFSNRTLRLETKDIAKP